MCRAGQRHCRSHYSPSQLALENARRRLSRNTAKAEAAESAEDTQTASKYRALADAAAQEIRDLEHPVAVVGGSFQAAEPCPEGYIDLFHRTSASAAQTILSTYSMRSQENTDEAFFSTFNGTEEDAQGSGYGDAVVWIRVPEDEVEIDDEFPSGEEHYRVPFSAMKRDTFMVPGDDGLYRSASDAAQAPQASVSDDSASFGTAPQIMDHFHEKYPEVDVVLSKSSYSDVLVLNRIITVPQAQGAGKASAVMRELTQIADDNGWRVALTPSSDFGGSKSRLIDFYKRFGFVQNKGRNRDFEISEDMYRPLPH